MTWPLPSQRLKDHCIDEMNRFLSLAIAFLLFIVDCNGQSNFLLNPRDNAWKQEAPGIFKVRVTTTKGDFVLEIHKAWGPIGANRFYNLVRYGFYDDSRFYRIRAGAFAQFGIPGKPEIAKVWEHESIADDSVKQSNQRGYIAYAMTGPNARTTQLYINLKDNPQQDTQGFAPIGKAISGLEVVDALYGDYAETSGGGMRGGKQGRLFEEGNAYLDREFPKLDKLLKAEIIK
jgi:cyclophilin family peptidyl-prolyl cis-trans isomerase